MIEIGSADAPVIMNLSPHATPWRLWAERVKLLPPQEPTEAMAWGVLLEPLIVQRAAERLDLLAYKPHPRWYHPTRPWQRATPDAANHNGTLLIEAKAVRYMSPEAPDPSWLVQAQHQLMVFEAPEAVIAAFGTMELRLYRVAADPDFQQQILDAEERFRELVETETPPPVSAEDVPWIARAFPSAEPGTTVALGPEALAWERARQAAIREAEPFLRARHAAEAKIKAALGSAERATLPDGTTYLWKTQTTREHLVPTRTMRTLRRKGRKGEEDE